MCVQVASLYLWCRSFLTTQVPQCPASPRTLPSLAKTSPLTLGAGGKSSAFTTTATRTRNHWNGVCGALCPSSFSLLPPFPFFLPRPLPSAPTAITRLWWDGCGVRNSDHFCPSPELSKLPFKPRAGQNIASWFHLPGSFDFIPSQSSAVK